MDLAHNNRIIILGKKWAWLWKSTPEDAVQSEKEKEEEMNKAIEKLVRNEIGTQERLELVHDLAVIFKIVHTLIS